MPFKAEVKYVAVRPFTYAEGRKLARDEEVPFAGHSNDDRIANSTLVRLEVAFFCRRPRCKKAFNSIVKLLAHEASHNES